MTLGAAYPSHRYREWMRTGIRLFDTEPSSVLASGEYVNDLTMDDLEAAMQLLGMDPEPMRRSLGAERLYKSYKLNYRS